MHKRAAASALESSATIGGLVKVEGFLLCIGHKSVHRNASSFVQLQWHLVPPPLLPLPKSQSLLANRACLLNGRLACGVPLLWRVWTYFGGASGGHGPDGEAAFALKVG